MTDINASLKKTIDGEPGPQHKEKGKAEFKFIEGEDGVPYSYDKKVESRLTAIENKLNSVIENGSVNTQLTGSNVEEVIAIKRDLYTDTKRVYLPVPEDVKGCFVHVIVSGITGTFTDSQGYSLWAFPYQNSPGAPLGLTREKYETGWVNSTRGLDYASVYIHPDADPSLASDLHVFIPYRVNIGKMLRIDLRVEGEFDDGEGIDAEVLLRWLK